MKEQIEKLVELGKDSVVPAVDLFFIVFDQIYGGIDTEPMIACELHDDKCYVNAVTPQGNEYVLNIYFDLRIEFWADDTPCHFNQFPVYKQLFKFLSLSAAREQDYSSIFGDEWIKELSDMVIVTEDWLNGVKDARNAIIEYLKYE